MHTSAYALGGMKVSPLRFVLSLMLVALTACVAEVDSIGEIDSSEESIIGGEVDKSTRSVVAIVAWNNQHSSTCSGTIVAPHVVLTAAHCLEKAVADKSMTVQVFMGDSLSSPWPWLFRSVKEFHMHPKYQPGMVTLGNDIGVVITNGKLGRAPVPMNRTQLDDNDVGTPIRYVGFGMSKANDGTTTGTRRSAWLTMNWVTPGLIGSKSGGDAFTCRGDSGGPGLVSLDGVVRVVGVHSYGAFACNGTSWSTRADQFAESFVDPFIAKFDPGFAPL